MSSSELRYLIAANELAEQMEIVKQTDVANKLNVSKVSTYNAIERLRDKGFIEKNDRKIVLTDRGREVLDEYMTIIRFMSAHLSLHCGTTENQAYEDALNATCAFSDVTRNGVANFIKSEMKGAHHAPID
jgi:Mn-dependent DtxR family transcriptional regulator